tara:strand:+ start:149 stop:619 length:471 start_codon:yes stop_codon:yes gene_type:complete
MKIKGYENYEIFEDGRVINKHGRVMKFAITNSYKRICLCKNNKKKSFTLHRLLALHFIENTRPNIALEVDHIDRDKLNNSLQNLRWATREEQLANRGGRYEYPISKGGIYKHNKNNYRYQWMEDKILQRKYFKTLELAQAYQIEHLQMYHLQTTTQ